MSYAILRKTGRLRSGHEHDQGEVFHAVDNRFALCGTEPGRLSDWSTYQGDAVTCPRCLAKLTARPDPRDPDPSRPGIFRDHNCYKCDSGAKPCVVGNPRQCEYPRARND